MATPGVPVFKNPAPLAIIGAAISLISTLISMVSLIIEILKYLATYTIFFTILAFFIFNLFKFIRSFDIIEFIAERLLRSLGCQQNAPD